MYPKVCFFRGRLRGGGGGPQETLPHKIKVSEMERDRSTTATPHPQSGAMLQLTQEGGHGQAAIAGGRGRTGGAGGANMGRRRAARRGGRVTVHRRAALQRVRGDEPRAVSSVYSVLGDAGHGDAGRGGAREKTCESGTETGTPSRGTRLGPPTRCSATSARG